MMARLAANILLLTVGVARLCAAHDVHEGMLAGWGMINSAGVGKNVIYQQESVENEEATAHHTSYFDHSTGHANVSLKAIFVLCVLMYGSISCLWMLFASSVGSRVDGAAKEAFKVLLLCISWASCSVGMHVLNKSLSVKLQAPALISMVQMAIAVGCVGGTSIKAFRDSERSQLCKWLIVPFFFAAMLCTSFYTYQYISLSLLTVIRNLTPLVVLPIEKMLMPADKAPKVSLNIIGSICIMLAGAILYAGGIKNLSVIGIVFALINMVLAMSDRLIQRRLLTGECKGLASSVCTVMNNFWGAFPTIVLAACTHQIQDALAPAHAAMWKDPRIIVLLLLSGLVGIGICYLGFECQRAITATSFFVLQNVSKVAVVVAGVVLFHDPLKSAMSVVGLVLSLGGSFLYGLAQMQLTSQAAAAAKGKEKAGETEPLMPKSKV